MVNIDSFGFTAPWVMENSSDKTMLTAAKGLWKEMKLELMSVAIENADADSSSFKKAGIPAITFTGLDGHWSEFLHSQRDQLKNLKPESVFLGYRLVLPFVVHLDKQSCDAFRKK